VIATNQDGVIRVFSPGAEKITGLSRADAVGKSVADLFLHTKLAQLTRLRKPERNQVQALGQRRVLMSQAPILVDGVFRGAVVTFEDVVTIQEAEAKIRDKLLRTGFVAKTTFDDIAGAAPAMLRAKAEARLYASSDSTIVVTGESGTGKELFARAIHNASRRGKGPFVAVNCGAFPETLLESELFGYDEGAFTGARRGGKQGLIELAHRGSLFLDEIAEMPMSLQSRLLRVLEEREVMHVGGQRVLHVNIRVIAASNRDLWKQVREGRLREDLYYRLNVLMLRLPPLRERAEDIPLLAQRFLSELCPELHESAIAAIAHQRCLAAYYWPGNIRELKNVIERFTVLYPLFSGAPALLESLIRPGPQDSSDDDVFRALGESRGNRAEAARQLGISRSTLWRKIRRAQREPSPNA